MRSTICFALMGLLGALPWLKVLGSPFVLDSKPLAWTFFALYVLLIVLVIVFRADEDQSGTRALRASFDDLKSYVAENSDAGLKSKVTDLGERLADAETHSDGIFS